MQPHRIGFLKDLMAVMQELEYKVDGRDESKKIMEANELKRRVAEIFLERSIQKPCKNYIDKMHKAMDPSIFYQMLIELDKSEFKIEDILDEVKIEFFELAHQYEVCRYFEGYLFSWNWIDMCLENNLSYRDQNPRLE